MPRDVAEHQDDPDEHRDSEDDENGPRTDGDDAHLGRRHGLSVRCSVSSSWAERS